MSSRVCVRPPGSCEPKVICCPSPTRVISAGLSEKGAWMGQEHLRRGQACQNKALTVPLWTPKSWTPVTNISGCLLCAGVIVGTISPPSWGPQSQMWGRTIVRGSNDIISDGTEGHGVTDWGCGRIPRAHVSRFSERAGRSLLEGDI